MRLGGFLTSYMQPHQGSKTCKTCNETKPLEAFYKTSSSSDSRRIHCGVCVCKKLKEIREKIGAPIRGLRHGVLFKNARARARKRGIPFEITSDWIKEKLSIGRCEVTGIPFADYHSPWSPSLDQIIPGHGYTKENTQLVVYAYNMAKNRFSHDDVMLLAKALINGKQT